jgi:hypothetical protein
MSSEKQPNRSKRRKQSKGSVISAFCCSFPAAHSKGIQKSFPFPLSPVQIGYLSSLRFPGKKTSVASVASCSKKVRFLRSLIKAPVSHAHE